MTLKSKCCRKCEKKGKACKGCPLISCMSSKQRKKFLGKAKKRLRKAA